LNIENIKARVIAVSVLLCSFMVAESLHTTELPKRDILPHHVTRDELNLVAKYENRDLYTSEEFISEIHYPGNMRLAEQCDARGCFEGCTIGFGYNLGARWDWEIMQDMTPVVGAERAYMFATFAATRGTKAASMCLKPKKGMPTLTRDEAYALLKRILQKNKNAVVARLKKDRIELSQGQLATLVSLDYQNPRFVSKSRLLWKYLKEGNHDMVAWRIRHRTGTAYNKYLVKRRKEEQASYLHATRTEESIPLLSVEIASR
jgi:GH24 family phage-related lysozyme (muramidase)